MIYRVYFGEKRQYELVQAFSTDEVYRRYRPRKRAEITRVDEVVPSSEWQARYEAGERTPSRRRRKAAS